MKKLPSAEIGRRDQLVRDLQKAQDSVELAFTLAGAAVEKLNTAIEGYNEVIEAANGWRDDIHTQMEDYYGMRSEKWAASDAADSYSSWINAWENELMPLEVVQELEDMEYDAAEVLSGLPVAPE